MPSAVSTAKQRIDVTRMEGARRTASASARRKYTSLVPWPRAARQQRRRPLLRPLEANAAAPSSLPPLPSLPSPGRRPNGAVDDLAECGDGAAAMRCQTVDADSQPARPPSLVAEPMESMPADEARSIICCSFLARQWLCERCHRNAYNTLLAMGARRRPLSVRAPTDLMKCVLSLA
jgi:hypothetical protein